MPPRPTPQAADVTDLPALRWVVWPALAAGLALAAVVLGDANTAGFLYCNHLAQWLLPDGAWAAITLGGASLGVLALLAPSLKTRPQWLAACLLATPLGMLFSRGGKRLFELPRPAGVLDASRIHVIGEWEYFNSFPSGHTITAFLAASVVVLGWPSPATRLRAALVIVPLAALVAFSRLAVGAHWPADVLAGAGLGWLAGAFGVRLSARWTFWQSPTAVRTMAALALGASTAMLILDLGYPEARLYRLSLAAWGIGGALAVLMRQRKAMT